VCLQCNIAATNCTTTGTAAGCGFGRMLCAMCADLDGCEYACACVVIYVCACLYVGKYDTFAEQIMEKHKYALQTHTVIAL
jgi:hypothetical protein